MAEVKEKRISPCQSDETRHLPINLQPYSREETILANLKPTNPELD